MRVILYTILLFVTVSPTRVHSAGAGPVSAVTGFPAWIRDINGVQLQLCGLSGSIETPSCPAAEDVNAAGDEGQRAIAKAGYYGAEAGVQLDDGTSVRGSFFVEATEPGELGPAFVSNGIRIEIQLPEAAGSDRFFIVSSPWNEPATIRVAKGDSRAELTLPLSVIAYGPDFNDVSTGPVKVFLGNGTARCLDGGFLGDGISRAPLAAAGPAGTEVFSVTEAGGGSASTKLFMVRGRLFAPAAQIAGGFAVERATVSDVGAVSIGTLIASTHLGDRMQITGAGGVVFDPPIEMVSDGSGRFFANFPAGNLLAGPFPVMIDVAVTRNGLPVPALIGTQAPMTDLVIVRSASYSVRTRTLTVSAVSSTSGSRALPVTLRVRGSDAWGNPVGNVDEAMSGRSLVVMDIAVPPSHVTVTSSRGGRLTVPVSVR